MKRQPRLFVFVGYNAQELAATPDYDPPFRPGDVLAENDRGPPRPEPGEIVVIRLEDGHADGVWPEEVALLCDGGPVP